MHISLTPELEKAVRQKVAGGLYNNASEVVREALRGWMHREEEERAKLEALRTAVAIGMKQLDQGEFSTRTVEEIIEQAERETNGHA